MAETVVVIDPKLAEAIGLKRETCTVDVNEDGVVCMARQTSKGCRNFEGEPECLLRSTHPIHNRASEEDFYHLGGAIDITPILNQFRYQLAAKSFGYLPLLNQILPAGKKIEGK